MHTNGHDKDNPIRPVDYQPPVDAESPGYETTDVRVTGIVVFLTGLVGTLVVFFFVCYGIGVLINNKLKESDGPATKWTIAAGAVPPGKGQNLKSNAQIEQEQLAQITGSFPEPRLDIDDGNQATADLHAREDLLLEHYSTVDGEPGAIRIPIERAIELIAQRGLPVANAVAPAAPVAFAAKPEVKIPLTSGFARTGFELTVMEARKQKMDFGKAEAAAEPGPAAAK